MTIQVYMNRAKNAQKTKNILQLCAQFAAIIWIGCSIRCFPIYIYTLMFTVHEVKWVLLINQHIHPVTN